MEKNTVWYYFSMTISYVMHPFLMPAWFVVLMLSMGLMPLALSPQVNSYLFMVIGVNTILVPIVGVLLMRVFGLIKDYSLATRAERVLPMIIVIICYGLCGWMLSSVPMFFLLQRVMWTAMLCVLFALCVNFSWQISLHLIAAGASVGVVLTLLLAGYANMVWIFCGAVLCAGLLASARLYLGRHTPAQIGAGFSGGLVIAMLVMMLWPW